MRQAPEGFILPDFGDTAEQKLSEGLPIQHVGAPSGPAGPRKFVLLCSKGNLDMAYPGLLLANAAAGKGIETHIFFTFWGLDIVNKKTNIDLKFKMVGNTAVHIPELGYLRPGLEHVSMPQALGRIPGMTAMATKIMKKQIADLEVPTVPQFLDLLEAEMQPSVKGAVSATDFIELRDGA